MTSIPACAKRPPPSWCARMSACAESREHLIGGEPVLIVRLIEAPLRAHRQLCARELPGERRGRAEAEAIVVFLGLAAVALEAPARRRNREEDPPVALRRVHGRAPEHVAAEHAQARALLRVDFVPLVGRVGDDVVVVRVELIFAEVAGRVPARAVELDAAIDRGVRREIVDEAHVPLPEIVVAVRTPPALVHVARADDAVRRRARVVAEAGERGALDVPRGSAVDPRARAIEMIERAHVDDAGEREVAEERARRTLDHIEILDHLREDQAPVVVPLGVPIHRLVHGHAVDPEREVGRVIGAESAHRCIRGEAGALPLHVHLDAGGLSQQLPRRCRRRARDVLGAHRHRLPRLGALDRGRGDGDDGESCGCSRTRGVRGARSGVADGGIRSYRLLRRHAHGRSEAGANEQLSKHDLRFTRVSGAGVSRPPACAVRTPQWSAASEERRTDGRWKAQRERLALANDLGKARCDRRRMRVRRLERDDGARHVRADRTRAEAIVAAVAVVGARAVMIGVRSRRRRMVR